MYPSTWSVSIKRYITHQYLYGRLINFQLERFRSSGELTKWQIGWHPRMKQNKIWEGKSQGLLEDGEIWVFGIRDFNLFCIFRWINWMFRNDFVVMESPVRRKLSENSQYNDANGNLNFHLFISCRTHINRTSTYETHAPLKLLFDPT